MTSVPGENMAAMQTGSAPASLLASQSSLSSLYLAAAAAFLALRGRR
jgi:hypothetical protein